MMLENFRKHFQADDDNVVASEELIHQYKDKVPALLLDIWKTTGFGKYGNGLIEIIDPEEYEDNLWTWLGKEVDNYTPFAITGFGELLYYRQLAEGEEDVCLIDIQYRDIQVLTWDMESFFEDFLTDEEDRKVWLREELFMDAIAAKGKLEKGEVFTFVPVLALGGSEEVEFLQKANAYVYQDLVFQITG